MLPTSASAPTNGTESSEMFKKPLQLKEMENGKSRKAK